MPILWRSSMAIGDEGVDADHQRLIDIINTVEQELYSTTGNDELSGTLDELVAYTNIHFDREENLMRYTSYNGLIHHRQSHRELRAHLAKIRASIEAAKSEALPQSEKEELIILLRHWLLDHVLKEDMLLKAFLDSLS